MKGAEVVWLEPNCQTEQKGCYCCGRSPSHHGCMTPPSFCNGMVLLVFWLPTLSDLLLPSRFSIPCCFKWWKRRFFFFFKKKKTRENDDPKVVCLLVFSGGGITNGRKQQRGGLDERDYSDFKSRAWFLCDE
jgi:hypothetical protein